MTALRRTAILRGKSKMGPPNQQERDHEKLERFAVELLHKHVQSRRACGAWGELTLVLSFERGWLKNIETIDKTNIRADLLGPCDVGRQSATRQPK